MSATGENLTPGQQRAIAALLSEDTNAKVAQAAGITDRTLRRWFKVPAFVEALQAARSAAFDTAIGKLQVAAGEAVETLKAVMADTGAAPSARVSAARTVLELAQRHVERESFGDRLAEMEKRLDLATRQ